MRKVKRYRYVDVLQDMVKLYNDTLHCTIGMKPSEVTRGHVEQRMWWHQYKPKESYEKSQQMCKVPFGFKKGDHMRISHKAQTFQWGHNEKWTRSLSTFQTAGGAQISSARFARRGLDGNFLQSGITRGDLFF